MVTAPPPAECLPRCLPPPLPQADVGDSIKRRYQSLLQEKIDFISNPEFSAEGDGPQRHAWVALVLDSVQHKSVAPHDLPTHLRRICDAELLSPEQERILFREMNYLKFRAAALRSSLDTSRLKPATLDEIQSLLDQARSIRDHLIKANIRLVISVVKKFVTPQQSFDEMLSDGIMILMQAVDKFDYDRGFRFSTYAYRSIARHAYRTINAARREEVMFSHDAEQWAVEQPDHRSPSRSDDLWSHLRGLTTSMLDRLDRRERFIIRCRYALGSHRKARTFQYLADKLGISKERARQLERRAVSKMQLMATEHDLEEQFGTALV